MSDIKIKNQKIIKVGNSYAVTLDRTFVDRCQLKDGSDLIARYDEDQAAVTFATPTTYSATQTQPLNVAEKTAVYATKITPELQEWVKKFLEENEESMKELANL